MAAASSALSDGICGDGLLGVSIVFLLSFDRRGKHGSVEQCCGLPRQYIMFNGAHTAFGHCCHCLLDLPARNPKHERIKIHIIRRIFLDGKAMVDAGAASTSTGR